MQLIVNESSADCVRLALVGSLDMKGVQAVELKFLGYTVSVGKNTLVDLSQTTYITSIGIGMLLNASKGLQRKGAKLVLVNPHPLTMSILEAARLNQVVTIVADDASGVQALGA